MKKLSEQLNVNTTIKSVPFDNMNEIIKYVFKNGEYKFYLNSELIDVNDRFRIFEHENKYYIIKKTSKFDGNLEIKLAKKAAGILDGLKVDDYVIKVIRPTIYYDEDFSYILTEYMGNSLQEYNYSKQNKLSIEINTIIDILKLFLNKGILYRGFLPRNMVVNENVIYLLDWEDATFNTNSENKINLLWKTNFILNWSYFYDYKVLENELNKYCTLNQEPALLKYEEKFKNMANLDYDTVELRKFILKTVMESEKSINDETNDFVISPNDMAHLVSDLFNSDIDVLFDISSSVLRRKSETKYVELLKILSNAIIDYYLSKENMQKNVMKILLKFMEMASKNEINDDSELVILFENDKTIFYNKLKEILNKIMYDFNKSKFCDINFIRVCDYIYSFK